MNIVKAYDLPVRVLHWIFAGLFIISFIIGKFVDDESSLYAYHMISGLLMVVVVFLRITWGVIGPSTAKFSNLKLNPSDLFSYLSNVFQTQGRRYLGHNPASSYTLIILMIFTLGLAASGLLMGAGIGGEVFEEVHELIAHGFLLVVCFHIAGVILHHLRHNDGIMSSIITGKKRGILEERPITSNHPIAALLIFGVIIFSGQRLNQNYNDQTHRISLFGQSFFLGEFEEHENDHQRKSETYEVGGKRKRRYDNDNDDDD